MARRLLFGISLATLAVACDRAEPAAPPEPSPAATPAAREPAPAPAERAGHLSFVRAGRTWIADLEGEGVRQTAAPAGEASPDGRAVALCADGALSIVDVDGAADAPGLVPLEGDTPTEPRWFPDGARLLYRTGRAAPLLAVVDVEDGRRAAVPLERGIACRAAVPGHDGTYLLCHDGLDLLEVALGGAVRRRLPLSSIVGDAGSGPERLDLTPDGRWLAADDGAGGVHVYDRHARRGHRVTDESADARHPSWLPGGEALVVEVSGAVARVPRDGGELRRLLDDAARPSSGR